MIKGSEIRCIRCKGRKKIFKTGNAYSYTNTGGIEVKCPLCLGEGVTKSLEAAIEDIKKINTKSKKEKDFQNDDKPTEKSEET